MPALALVLALPTLAACTVLGADDPLGLPAVVAELELAEVGHGERRLAEVVDAFAAANAIHVLSDAATRELLSSTWCGLDAGVRVPPGEVYAFVEGLLDVHGFLLSATKDGTVPLLAVHGPEGPLGPYLGVPVEHLPRLLAHPVLLAETTLHLPHVDVRQLATTWRGFMTDSRSQAVVAAGEKSLILRGPGRDLAGWAAMLQEIDRRSAPGAEQPEPPALAGPQLALPQIRSSLVLPAPPAGPGEREAVGLPLLEVVDAFAAQSGIPVVMNGRTRAILASARCGIDAALEVPPDEVLPFLEGLLAAQGGTLMVLQGAGFPLLRIGSGMDGRGMLQFLPVGPDGLAELADHPALLVQTVISLPHVDVRQLTTTWRGLAQDTNTQSVLAVGSHQVLLSGTGRVVAHWAALMGEVERGELSLEGAVERGSGAR